MSVQIEVEAEIDRPVEEVFEFVTAVENDEKWHPRVVESPPLDGEMRVGATWGGVAEGLVGTSEVDLECIEYDPPSRFGYRTPSGMLGGRLKTTEAVYTFTGHGDRTHVTWSATMKVSGFLRLLEPIVPRMVRSDVETSFGELRSLLEEPERKPKREAP